MIDNFGILISCVVMVYVIFYGVKMDRKQKQKK